MANDKEFAFCLVPCCVNEDFERCGDVEGDGEGDNISIFLLLKVEDGEGNG
ncbi:hypothetical protein GCM10010217_74880 [Streptomyces tubercidicus]